MGFGVALTPFNLMMAVAGVLVGILIGALPGVGPPSGVAMLLPLTFGMDPTSGIIMLAALYAGTMYGGTITAVLINTPGESASVVTCLDGYQMALQGRAGPALGIAAIGSFIAGTIGVVLLMLVSPLLARWSLSFGPPETFALMLLGLTTVTLLAGDDPHQGLHQHGVRPDAGDGRLRHHLGRRALRLRHHRDDGRHRLPAGGDRPVRPGRGAGRRRAEGRRGAEDQPQAARRAAQLRRLGAQQAGRSRAAR